MGVLKTARIQLVASFILSLYAASARADEQIIPLAQDGDWAALEHSTSITDPPDVCLAINLNANFGIRADNTDIEFRLENHSWALPADITGTIEPDVNGNQYPFPITSNTSTSIAAEVDPDKLLDIVSDMNKASSMTVTAGHAAPEQVSLNGSNTVIAAFLTCANIQAPGEGGGANPFSEPSSSQ